MGPSYFFRLTLLIPLLLLILLAPARAQFDAHWETVDSLYGTTRPAIGPVYYERIACADPLHCVAVANVPVWKSLLRATRDGGNTWTTPLVDTATLGVRNAHVFISVSHPSPELILVASDSGSIYRSSDGGESWKRIELMPYKDGVAEIHMMNTRIGVAVVGYPNLFSTDDEGESWQKLTPPNAGEYLPRYTRVRRLGQDTYVLTAYLFLPDSNSASHVGTYRTENSGATWSWRPVIDTNRNGIGGVFADMEFVGGDDGMAVGWKRFGMGEYRSYIRQTSDGGALWTVSPDTAVVSATSGTGQLARFDSQHAIAVGPPSLILRTSDGGTSWINESIVSWRVGGIKDIAYPSRDRAFLVSHVGTILRWTRPVPTSVALTIPERDLGVHAFPNPARGSVTLAFDDELLQQAVIEITALDGRLIRRVEATVGSRSASIDTGGLPPGQYLVVVSSAGSRSALMLTVYPE